MSYTRENVFDRKVSDRISKYIKRNGLSIRVTAERAGMTYNGLYQTLHKNQLMKLKDYVAICKALDVDLDFFIK